jgi:hypothetical protein
VAIDEATRLASVDVLPDEYKATTVGFLTQSRACSTSTGPLFDVFSLITARPIAWKNGKMPATP